MKLMVCICQNKYANGVLQAINAEGYRSTKLASHGGFLKRGNTTLLIGIQNERKEELLSIIEEACNKEDMRKSAPSKETATQKRVTVFVVDALAGAVM